MDDAPLVGGVDRAAQDFDQLGGLPGRLRPAAGLVVQAAARIPMQVAQVFVAKRRVQNMLRQEVARLEGPDPE